MLILLSLLSGGAFDATMPFMNADLILYSGGYAENIDKSGLIRGRIVEELLMGRNAAGRFQKEINDIVQDNVPLCFLPLWKRITIKMQKIIKKHFKKQNLLVRWDKKRILTSEPAEYTQNAFMDEYFTQPAEHEIKIYTLRQHPPTLTMDSRKMSGKRDPLFPKMYVRRATGGDCSNKSICICCCIMFQRFDA